MGVWVVEADSLEGDFMGLHYNDPLPGGQFVQGALVSRSDTEARVYIVILLAPGTTVNEGKWWPRVVQAQMEIGV